jgi:uncharacterized protein (TIGR02996 family)
MEEAALLAAIAAHPAEDTPRLAYADWLDEHAADLPDPDAARTRAEFIRVQCELNKLKNLPSKEHQRYVDLYRREDAILTNHRRDLLGPLGEDVTDEEMHHEVVFDRGFLAELTLDAERFLKHADAIARLQPLPRVSVAERAWWQSSLFGSPYVGVIWKLDLGPSEPVFLGFSPASRLGTLLRESGDWTGLRELSVEGCLIHDDGLRVLAVAPNLPALIHLDVSHNEISDDGVLSLVNSFLWSQLKRLVLGGNPLSDEGANVLAGAAGTSHLEYLNLRFTGLTTDGHRVLLRSFPRRTKLDLF